MKPQIVVGERQHQAEDERDQRESEKSEDVWSEKRQPGRQVMPLLTRDHFVLRFDAIRVIGTQLSNLRIWRTVPICIFQAIVFVSIYSANIVQFTA